MSQSSIVGRNFKDDPDCVKHLPIAEDGANLYEKCKDGILLWSVHGCRYIHTYISLVVLRLR